MRPPSTIARSDRRRRPWMAVASMALMASHLVGCLTVDGELKADGTGTLTLSHAVLPQTTEASQRERLEAPGIEIESLAINQGRVTAKLRVLDLAAISKTVLLKDTTVSTSAEGDVRTLTIAVRLPKPAPKVDKTKPGPRIRLTLPGKVLDANEQGVVDGKTVQWTFPIGDWVAKPAWELRVRFEAPPQTEKPAPTAG